MRSRSRKRTPPRRPPRSTRPQRERSCVRLVGRPSPSRLSSCSPPSRSGDGRMRRWWGSFLGWTVCRRFSHDHPYGTVPGSWGRPWTGPCLRCGYDPMSDFQQWRPPAVPSSGVPPRGTAAPTPAAPEAIREGSTLLRDLNSVSGSGVDATWRYEPGIGWSWFDSSTGAPVRGAHSTSTPTPSSGSPRSREVS